MAAGTNSGASAEFFSTLNTEVEVQFQELFSGGSGIAGSHTEYTDVSTGHTGTTLEINVVGAVPVLREWVGARHMEGVRGYKQSSVRKDYEKSLKIPAIDLDTQGGDAVRKRVMDFLPTVGYDITKIAHDFWLTNPDCYDGVALYSASHVHGASDATQSNLTSSDLSLSTAYAAINAMRNLTDNKGRILGINPNKIYVGGLLLPRALEIFQADQRVISVDYNGAETGNRIAAAASNNVYRGMLDVVYDPLITDYTAYLMDTTKAAKPVLLREIAGYPDMTALTAKTDANVFYQREYVWGVQWASILAAGAWQTSHKIAGSA